ncbi:uncharacterized protein [Coffea arabica]|uniref:Uncharacterized protein isoform X5 n=1 Tax=Coffea arabica TaxID=13443 RepID=A0ABM4VW52_COFAR
MDFHNLKRRELQELCKKHKIPANLTNLEMATKLTALLRGNQQPLTRGRRSCLKGLEENVSENESDFENRPAKKVRFSPQNEMIEFEKSAVKCMETRGRGRRKSAMNHSKGGEVVENDSPVILVDEGVGRGRRSRRGKVIEGSYVKRKGGKMGVEDNVLKDKLPSASGVVGMSSDAPMDEGAGRVTRSRKVKFMEDCEVESKGGKKGMKADALKGELPSAAADNAPLVDFSNEEHVVVGKRCLRNRVVDVEKKKIALVEKGSQQNEEDLLVRKRSLRNIELKDNEMRAYEDVEKGSRKPERQVKDMRRKDIVRTKATEEEPEAIQAEKVLRRSRRHVAKMECHKLVKEDVRKIEKAVQRRLRSIVAVEVKEVSEVDSVSGMMKESYPFDENLRRSKRNAAKPEVIYTREQTDKVANAKGKEESKKRRRDAFLQEQAVKVDGNSVERPLRRSTRNTEKIERVAATTVRGKVAQKQKGKSKKTRGKFEDSFTEEILITEDLLAPEAELMIPEIVKDTVIDNFNVVVDLTGYVSDLNGADTSEPNFIGEDSGSVSGTFVNADSPFTDNRVEKKVPGTNGKSVHPLSDDNDVQKQGGETCTDESSKWGNDSEEVLYMSKTAQIDKNNRLTGQRICSDVSLNGVIHDVNELVGMSESIIPETYSTSLCDHSKEQQMHESIAHESGQLNLEESYFGDHEKSLPVAVCKVATIDTLNCCTLDTAVNPLDNAVQNEQDGHSNFKRGILEEYWHPSSSDALRLSTTREVQDGNVDSGEDTHQPLEMHRIVSAVTPISANAVESLIEFTQSNFVSIRVELHKSNILELQDGLNCKVAGESLDAADLETQLEPRAQSPIEQGRGVEAKLIEDGDNLVELSDYEEVGHLKHKADAIHDSCQSNELESVARNKLCILPEQGATNDEESVVISDAQGVILSLHGEGTPIPNGGKHTEIKLSASKHHSVTATIANSSSILRHQSASANTKNENSILADDNAQNQGENTRLMNSGEALKQKEESSCGERNSHEVHYHFQLGTYFTHHELISREYGKSDGDGQSKDCCDTSDECQDSLRDASRSSIDKILQEENVHGGETFVVPSHLHEKALASTLISTTAIETECKFGESIFDTNRVELPKAKFNFEFLGAFTEKVGSEKQSEVRTQSPNQQRKGVDGDFAVEAYTALADGQNSAEVAKLEEGGLLKDQDVAPSDSLQHAEFDSSARSKFSFIKDQAVSCAEAIDGTANSHFVAEPYTALEDGQNSEEVAKFEEIGHSRNPDTSFDCLLHAQFNSSTRSTFSFIQDQGVPITEDTVEKVHLSPPSVATNNTEERNKGIELSARKCNSLNKTLSNSSFFSECQRDIACGEGETNEESDPIEAYHMIQMASTSKDYNSEGCDKSMDGSLDGVIDALNVELGSKTDVELGLVTESMGANGNYVLCFEADTGGEMLESSTGEESGPFNLEATNEPESVHSLDTAPEVATTVTLDSCPSHSAQTPSKSCNKNEHGQKLELTDEPVSLSTTEEEKNNLSSEEEVKHDFLSLKKISSSGRDGCSGQHDVVHGREEQEKDISSYEELVDSETAVDYETQRTNQQNIFPTAAEGNPDGCNFSNSWHGDELKMLFGNSETSHKVLCLQERDDGAYAKSVSEFASEFKDNLVLSNSTPAQHDDQKIGDSEIQKENEVGKSNTSETSAKFLEDNQNDKHAESGTEVPTFSSLEMNIHPQESKGDQSFSFDQSKDVKVEIETSEATFVGEEVTTLGHDAEDKVGELVIQDSFASESFISKSHELSKECDDDTMIDYINSESTENVPSMINSPEKNLIIDALAAVAELANLVEPEAKNVEKTGTADIKNVIVPAEEQKDGEAREESNHQYLEDAGGVLEDTIAMHSETHSSSNKNSDSAADESIKSPSKPFMSTFKGKNRRTILIHGTPNKLQTAVDMKENAPNSKLEKVGTWTTVRPAAKRPALKDLLHK